MSCPGSRSTPAATVLPQSSACGSPSASAASTVSRTVAPFSPEEADLYRDLVDGTLGPSVRLEHERISFAAIRQALAACH